MLKLYLICIVVALLSGFVAATFYFHSSPSTPIGGVKTNRSTGLFADRPSYSMLMVNRPVGDDQAAEDAYAFSYPVLSWPGHEARVQLANALLEKEMTSHLESAKDPGCQFYNLVSDVEMLSPKLLSVRMQIDCMFEGAAHPQHPICTFNFDLERNRKIQFDDILPSDTQTFKALQDFCGEALAGASQDLDSNLYESRKNFGNFFINDSGVTFYFDYVYAFGNKEVTVPFEQELLKARKYQSPSGDVVSL